MCRVSGTRFERDLFAILSDDIRRLLFSDCLNTMEDCDGTSKETGIESGRSWIDLVQCLFM